MNMIELIEEGLNAHGYDGLFTDECGCVKGVLSPAGCLIEDCMPGHMHRHSDGKRWVIARKRAGMTDEEIEDLLP